MTEKGFLIRMKYRDDSDNENMIKAFFTENISELLSLFKKAKENEIPIEIPIELNQSSDFDGKITYVKDMSIHFGGQESLLALDIWVDKPLDFY